MATVDSLFGVIRLAVLALLWTPIGVSVSSPTTPASIAFKYNISEELPVGTTVGDVKQDYFRILSSAGNAKDDRLTNLQFSLRSSGSNRYFQIGSTSGVIRTAQVLDRESICRQGGPTCVVNLDIVVMPIELFAVIKVSVNVIDVNDHAPRFSVSDFRLEILDSSPPGALFPIPSAEDSDSGLLGVQRYMLQMEVGDLIGRKFELVTTLLVDGSQDVRIRLKSRLDDVISRGSTNPTTFNLSVVAIDGGIPARSGSLLLRVTLKRAIDSLPKFENAIYRVVMEENPPDGSWVIQVKTLDQDKHPVSYSLATADQSNRKPFRIDARTGSVYVNGQIDYERDRYFLLTIVATSVSRPLLTTAVQLEVNVTDLNDNAPQISVNTLTRSGHGHLAENSQIGTFVAHIVVSDADEGVNAETNCIVQTDLFKLDPISGSGGSEYKLVSDASFDREEKARYDVKIVCEDSGNLASSVTLDIDVIDENDNDPVFSQSAYSVQLEENSKPLIPLIRVSAMDLDQGANSALLYSLVAMDQQTTPSTEPNVLFIDPTNGDVYCQVELDYESGPERRSFLLIASDGGEPSRTGTSTLILQVFDVNEDTPRFVSDYYHFNVAKRVSVGTRIGSVIASDSDGSEPNRKISYNIEPTSIRR